MTAPLTRREQKIAGTVTGPLVAAIEQTWAAIQARHPDVPDVVLTLGNGSARPGHLTLGHFHAGKWATSQSRLAELFIGGEGLSRGPRAVLGTLLHEATHGVAAAYGIRDTSRQGRYHNTRFRELATELGLTVERDPVIGWSITTVPETTAEEYEHEVGALGAALTAHRLADIHRDGRTSSNNGLVATCECDPPRRIRIARSTYETGPVTCGVCESDFTAHDTNGSALAAPDGREFARDAAATDTFDGGGQHAMGIDPWSDVPPLASSRDAEMSELRQRRPGLFTLHEAAINAVTAREHAHEAVARRTLDRIAAHIDAGHDDRVAADTAQAELADAEPEQLHRSLDEYARRSAYPVIDRDLEARVLAVPVTEQDIDVARTAAERDVLVDLAACQHAITRLRDTSHASTAADAAGLYLECREQHGHHHEQARSAAFLEVSEGIRAEHDTARYRLDAQAEERREEQTVAQRRDTDAGLDPERERDVTGSAPRSASWEDVRAPLLRVGDVTPRGPITAIDYHGELGVTVHVGDEEYHRGRDDLVSRRAEGYSDSSENLPDQGQTKAARDQEDLSSVEDSLYVDSDELVELTAGAQERRATASRLPDDIDRLRDMLVRDHEEAPQLGAADPGLHQHHAVTNSHHAVQSATPQPRDRDGHDVDATNDAGDHLHSAAVDVHARAAVAAVRQRNLQQQAEEARTEQLNRWQYDDRADRNSAEQARSLGGRGTNAWGAAR